jgi:hypothetical protein
MPVALRNTGGVEPTRSPWRLRSPWIPSAFAAAASVARRGSHVARPRTGRPARRRSAPESPSTTVGTSAGWFALNVLIANLNLDLSEQIVYTSLSLAHEGRHRRRSCKAEQGVASPERFATVPGRTTPSTPGATTPRAAIAAWSREERKQNAGPGPKNVTVERREARRRVAPAPGSRRESESPRAVMHATGCTRSIRAPIGAPPAPHWGWGWKKERRREGRKNEDHRNKFVARMSEATCGAPRRGPRISLRSSGLRSGAV